MNIRQPILLILYSCMIGYAPPDSNDARYRPIRLQVIGMKNPRIRVREGYYVK